MPAKLAMIVHFHHVRSDRAVTDPLWPIARTGDRGRGFGPLRPSTVPFSMPPARRIGKVVLAFKWSALAFTALATAIALWDLVDARNLAQLVSVPGHFVPVPQSVLPHTVSNFTVGTSLVVLGVIVVVQLVLLGFTQQGRYPAPIPIVTEIALWIGFCLASYEMQRGYRAAVACAGPPTHCSVSYPSVIPVLVVGLIVGAVFGGAWRIAFRFDQRRLAAGPPHVASAPIVAEPQ